jgi:hypothetical protein
MSMRRCSTTDLSVRGRWTTVPSLDIDGELVIATGRWLRVASIHDDEWREAEVREPRRCIEVLQERSHGLKADLFTFTQKLPATAPKYDYRMEWDNVAAIPLRTFADWWNHVPHETRKNVRRSQRRGVAIRTRNLDAELVRAIVGVNNDSPVRQRVRFTHFGKTADEVSRDYVSFLDRSEFICAYSADELIGFMKLVYCGPTASILQLLSKRSEHDQRPSNALIAAAVER